MAIHTYAMALLARLAGYARASAGCDEGRGFGDSRRKSMEFTPPCFPRLLQAFGYTTTTVTDTSRGAAHPHSII